MHGVEMKRRLHDDASRHLFNPAYMRHETPMNGHARADEHAANATPQGRASLLSLLKRREKLHRRGSKAFQ